jgi:hypothetical protein
VFISAGTNVRSVTRIRIHEPATKNTMEALQEAAEAFLVRQFQNNIQ